MKYTKLQAYMAVASFSVGTLISCVCLFLIEPQGEIDTTAISIVSEFLVLAGGLLGIKASFDTRMQKFETEIRHKIKDRDYENDDMDEDEQDLS